MQLAVDAATPGESLCLAAGEHLGPVVVRGGISIWGTRAAVIRSRGSGTTVRLEGHAPALLGVTVDGSGTRFDLLDAAVHVSGRGARVEHVHVVNATFGILIEKAREAMIRGNFVRGNAALPFGLRGDGIRLWEAHDCSVEDNQVSDSRDTVLWYASRNRLRRNRIERGRYGAHLMYSHGNEVTDNFFVANVAGLFVMYSRDVAVRRNVFGGSGGASGMGLGLKESGNLQVEDNAFIHDAIGIYVDSSPLWPEDRNTFERNVFRLTEVGVSFLGGSSAGSRFVDNDFRDARLAVEVEGRGNALKSTWLGNHFDDYAGYDLDGDGTGDVPHELRSIASDLVSESPVLAFFRGTPALHLAEVIGRLVPLFEPRLLLRDPAPRMAGRSWAPADAD